MPVECDVLIIGAGPAGAVAAATAAAGGVSVVLLEKRREVGVPVQCAEFIPRQIRRDVDFPDSVIAWRVETMRTHMPDGEVVESPDGGFIIHRDQFDQALVQTALQAGVRLRLGCRVTGLEANRVLARLEGREIAFQPRYIIGADGPHSIVGHRMNSRNRMFIQSYQYRMRLRRELHSTEIYFQREIPGGYGWIFPKGELANVGVGVDRSFGVGPGEALKKFAQDLVEEGVVEPEILQTTGGFIPAGGLTERLVRKNMILAGDAAGVTHPVTGAGVAGAVLSGSLAGEMAARAAAEDNPEFLAEYEEECRMLLEDSLRLAVRKRRELERHWKSDNGGLTRALRRGWIAFEEYYRERS